jgi:hypothetical protein
MEEMNAYEILIVKPEGKRPLGRALVLIERLRLTSR